MSHYFQAVQLHNSPADCAGELLKLTKDMTSLLVCIFLNLKVLDFSFLWVTS